jgi:hypothetical protein
MYLYKRSVDREGLTSKDSWVLIVGETSLKYYVTGILHVASAWPAVTLGVGNVERIRIHP